MNVLVQLAETVAEEEASGLPLALSLGIGTFLLFAVLLFAVSRLNPDR
ncbi:MAG: hypothetical protein LH630_02005 [Actinomycetia bacterium]|nr:hypothetical protein [Actinomycetes bacterium]